MKKVYLILGLLFSYASSFAQLNIVDNQTAQQLAEMLVGQGVVISNATLNGTCPGSAVGKFDFTAGSLIDVDSGIILTCGQANGTTTPYGANAAFANFASTGFPPGFPYAPGDPELTDLINLYTQGSVATNDACVLEFDFVPSGDTVKFDYVFASEEYNGPHGNFNCSINDVFGFFITGPGYAGSTNIALIPGTNVMVGVSTVNDGTGGSPGGPCDLNTQGNGPYTQYYNVNPSNPNFTYSGFTDVFTAIAQVVPCETYHLKLAIADASDNVYDSGVFIKAGSLMTTSVKLTPATGGGQNDNQAHSVRGCKPAKLAFGRTTCDSTVPMTYQLEIGGTAQNGTDYTFIPSTFTIPANTNTDTLLIQALNVQFPPGTPEYLIIGVYHPDSVAAGVPNPPIISQDTVWIYDSLYVNISTAPQTICPRDTIYLNGEVAPGLNYTWSPAGLVSNPSSLNVYITPAVSTQFTLTVTQPGAPATCPPVSRKYNAIVEPIPQIITTRDTVVCLADSINLNVYANPSTVDYNWNWSPADYLRDDFSANNKFFAPVGDYKYVITATTPVANCSNKDSIMIHVVPPFTFDYVSPDTTIKYGDRIMLTSESEAIYWLWSPVTFLSDPLAQSPYATPLEDIQYTLIGINQFGCRDTALVNIKVEYDSWTGVPNAFSPNGDGINDVFKLENKRFDKLVEFRIFNRYGNQVFSTTDASKGWDGTIDGKPAPAEVYFYTITVVLPDATPKNIKGDLTLVR